VRSTPPWTAYLKIAEGCDHTCSFCAIPGFRGRFRSRTAESILAEAGRLVGEGVRELNLIAQDTSHYGRDLGVGEGLADLVERFDEIEALRWVRLHYLYPNTITPKLIRAMARSKRVVDYVDMPLQHAHPAMLRRMRRGGSAESHLRLLARFRKAMPDVALRTTLIVGFPGETDQEYEALLDFVREARFDHLGVFLYSHERDTTAFELSDDVPGALKQERHDRLMECQQSIAFERNSAMLGQTVEVLVEGAHEETEHLLVGRTARQAPDVDGQILIHEGQAAPGEFVQVELRETAGYDVVGGIVETRPPAGATG
jgi:ribosomal protein S12 methylthiotransferase